MNRKRLRFLQQIYLLSSFSAGQCLFLGAIPVDSRMQILGSMVIVID